jgi:hypothetical protein
MKIIVDGDNIGWIAAYSHGELSVDDELTGTIFGFLRMMFSIADRFETNQFIYCWDSRKNFRKRIYPEYKQKRHTKELTEEEEILKAEVRRQFVELRKYVLPKMGFSNIVRKIGYEADDLIASIVRRNPKDEFCIMSTDNDLFQLLGYEVFVFNPITKVKMTAKRFKMEYSISHNKWVEAKCIGGCNSDEVKGIRGAADPRNNPNSLALSYIRGDLTKGVVFDRITSSEGKEIIARNRKLIGLPFKNHRALLKVNIKRSSQDKFIKKNWIDVFDQYDFRYFMQAEQLEKLEELFKI